jgi:hypothetical protein
MYGTTTVASFWGIERNVVIWKRKTVQLWMWPLFLPWAAKHQLSACRTHFRIVPGVQATNLSNIDIALCMLLFAWSLHQKIYCKWCPFYPSSHKTMYLQTIYACHQWWATELTGLGMEFHWTFLVTTVAFLLSCLNLFWWEWIFPLSDKWKLLNVYSAAFVARMK